MDDGSGGVGIVMSVIYVVVAIVMIVSMWKVFEKGGKPGWASIVPIYNIIVMLEIADKPLWWVLLLFIPIVNVVISIMVMISFAEAYGKSAGFGIGLALLPVIFLPILAFTD